MSFSFDDTIPAANNNPSFDQPVMLQNNVSNQGIWTVDHIGFNAANGGTHAQLNFAGFGSSTLLGPAPASLVYPAAGVADTANAQLYFKNSDGTFPISLIRACGYFSNGAIVIGSQQVNVSSVVHTSTGIYTISLVANAVTSNAFIITALADSSVPSLAVKYHITGIGTFQLQFFATTTMTLTDPNNFSFIVLQI